MSNEWPSMYIYKMFNAEHLHNLTQDKIKIATVSLMTDYLNPEADSEILHGGSLLILT